MKWRRKIKWTVPPSVPLESLPPEQQALFEEAARVYREKWRLPADAPLQVILPKDFPPSS